MTPLGNKLCWRDSLQGMNSVGKERYFAEVDDNSAGDTIVELCWKINSAGDRKTSPGTIFPWQLAEDNPVISWWGNNL